MNELVERMVAAIVGPGAMCRMSKAEAEDVATEVLKAIREPTQAMKEAGAWEGPRWSESDTPETDAGNQWRAMIDAALR